MRYSPNETSSSPIQTRPILSILTSNSSMESWSEHVRKSRRFDLQIDVDASIHNLPTPSLTNSSTLSSISSTSSTCSSALAWPLSAQVAANEGFQLQDSPESLPCSITNNFIRRNSLKRSNNSEPFINDQQGHSRRRGSNDSDLLHLIGNREISKKLRAPPPAPIIKNLSDLPSTLPNEKDKFVEGLLGICVVAIESIWGSQVSEELEIEGGVLPLRIFVRETLRRSRTSCSTLQLALYYLHKSRTLIRDRVTKIEAVKRDFAIARAKSIQENFLPTPPPSPPLEEESELNRLAREILELSKDSIICGRRTFLASIMLASKYLQDRNYSTRAWNKISGLPILELNSNEANLLAILDYKLFTTVELFENWTARLRKLAEEQRKKGDSSPPTSTSRSLMRSMTDTDLTSIPLTCSTKAASPLSSSLIHDRPRPCPSLSTSDLTQFNSGGALRMVDVKV